MLFLPTMRILILIAAMLSSTLLFSQSQWELQYGKGFLIPHRPVMQVLQTGPVHLFSIARMQVAGSGAWKGQEASLKGVRLSFQNFSNADALGSAIGLNYLLRVPIGAGFKLTFGGGLGYLTEDYSSENPDNIAIGSAVNASILFELSKNFYLASSELQLGLAFNHYSNASYSAPNLGLNIPSVFVGFSPRATPPPEKAPSGNYAQSKSYMINWVFGSKENSIADNQRYYSTELSIIRSSASKGLSQLDLFASLGYNGGISSSIESGIDIIEQDFPKSKASDNIQFGLGLGYRVNFARTQVFIHQGYYLVSEQPEVGKLFHKLGLTHWLHPNWGLGFILKTHFAKADYGSISLTYKLGGYAD